MDKILVNNWNSVVKNNDRVFMLGDFCLAGKNKIIEIGNKLNGRKTLIMGNHERNSLKVYYDAGFVMIYKHPILLENTFLLSHSPIKDTKYINIHGHIHEKSIKDLDYFNGDLKLYYNVSCDVINFTPISLNKIKKDLNLYTLS